MQKNILIIDDEELVRDSLARLLKMKGYGVTIAESGIEALEKVKDQDFNLIVSDIRMQEMDGVETVRQIRAYLRSQEKPLVPEILITGYASDETFDQAQDLKVADYIYKPFDINVFLESVQKNIQ